MPEDEIPMTAPTGNQKIARWMFSWGLVGAVALSLLGCGVSLMTATHPYIADAFCITGIVLLIVKFWTWEEAKHDSTRKTAMLLSGVTIILLGAGVGLCILSSYLSRPVSVVTQSNPPKQPLMPPSAQAVPAAAPEHSETPITPVKALHQSRLSKPKSQETAEPNPCPSGITNTVENNTAMYNGKNGIEVEMPCTKVSGNFASNNREIGIVVQSPPTYQQNCVGSACAQGPGAQATYVAGDAPPAARHISPDNLAKAVALLKQSGNGSIYFITYPTQAKRGGEISNFADELESAFRQGGWGSYRERNVHIGSVTLMEEGAVSDGSGIGCSSPRPPTEATAVARKALALLGYPCLHVSISDPEPSSGPTPHPYALYVSVGTRIETEK